MVFQYNVAAYQGEGFSIIMIATMFHHLLWYLLRSFYQFLHIQEDRRHKPQKAVLFHSCVGSYG
jgi:hypothetical protein